MTAAIRDAIPQADAYLLRGPGILGGFVAAELEGQGKAYATQVIGDFWEVFGAGKVGGLLRPVLRHVLTQQVKRICKKAVGVSYVTGNTLQQRYPASSEAFVSSWSDVQIGRGLASEKQILFRLQRNTDIEKRQLRLGFIGSLEQPYKGADVLMEAVSACRKKGFDVAADVAGDGRLRPAYEAQAKALGISGNVKFLGRLGAGEPIFEFFDSIDLFVMPSLTEGLPRAMVEAMARGCPCIGSKVGGIPELLQIDDLVPPADSAALASKIMEMAASSRRLNEAATRNHKIAGDFMPERAQARRSVFLHALRNHAMVRNEIDSTTAQRHLAFIVTVPLSLTFLRGQVRRLREAGFHISVICSPGPQTAEMEEEGAEVITVPMERELAPLKDLRSLWRLWRVLRRVRPDIVNVGTPKAGLLGGMAARLAGVPHRVYTLHGLRLETAKGFQKLLLTMTERLSCANVQHVRCVSNSLRQRVVDLGLASGKKAYVLGQGSANGVDCEYFRRTPERIETGRELRKKMGIPAEAPVIGFAGRLTRDKGINELYHAFARIKELFPELRLLLLGDFESGDPVDAAVHEGLEGDSRVVLAGTVVDVAPYYAVMDILALPSHREGLPTVSLEAQAASVPVVTTRVTGAAESVLDRVTGILVPAGDAEALASALRELLEHPEQRRSMGAAGAAWVGDRFRQEVVWQSLIDDYNQMGQTAQVAERAVGAYQ